jgi:hypothetical protein
MTENEKKKNNDNVKEFTVNFCYLNSSKQLILYEIPKEK